ncbi:MAG: polysaccharide lyase family 8 super-sandwich domain-containing protein [Sedimentisphaeraceae bacterium JB056]
MLVLRKMPCNFVFVMFLLLLSSIIRAEILSINLVSSNIENGITEQQTSWSETGLIGNIEGKANNADWVRRLRFAVDETLIDTSLPLAITVKWFDDPNAPSGANWLLRYDSMSGMKQLDYVHYGMTGQWKENTFIVNDARFTQVCDGYGAELSVYHSAAPLDVDGDDITDLYGPLVDYVKITPLEAMVVLGDTNVENGMPEQQTAWSDSATVSYVEGKANVYDWARRLRFAVDETQVDTSLPLAITVKWFDDSNAPSGDNWWRIRYDSTSGMKELDYIHYTKTGQWKENTFIVNDARFTQVCDGYGAELSVYHCSSPLDVDGDNVTDLYGPLVASVRIEISQIGRVKVNATERLLEKSATDIYTEAYSAYTTMSANGSWSDLDYDEEPATNWDVTLHYNRLLAMSKAYCKAGQSYYQNSSIKTAIETALDYGDTNVFHDSLGERAEKDGNWWYWEIGVPRILGPALVLLQNSIDDTIFTDCRDSIEWLIGDTIPQYEGANGTDVAMTHLFLSLIDCDTVMMDSVASFFADMAVVNTAPTEGILEDNSFRQHRMIYNGGYGQVYVLGLEEYIGFYAKDTQYQLPQENLDIFGRYLTEGEIWTAYNGYWDLGVLGRSAGSGNKSSMQPEPGLEVMSTVAHSSREQLLNHISAIENQEHSPVGHRHFWESDFTAHHNDNWYSSVKMHSQNNIAAEGFGGQGMMLWYMGDGVTWFLTDGDEYCTNNVLPTLDWTFLPGTTVEDDELPCYDTNYIHSGIETFVGGTCADDYGVTAMQLGHIDTTMRAKKSWHFFDDEVVCLGSDIDCNNSNSVYTVINQRPLVSGVERLYVDGSSEPYDELTIQLGDQNVESGITEQQTTWSDYAEIEGVEGKANNADWVRRLRFAVDESLVNTSLTLSVIVRWFDDPNAVANSNWLLRYDSTTGMKQSGYVNYSYTGQWKETIFEISDARFTQVCDGYGAEMSIYHSSSPLDVDNDGTADLYGPLVESVVIVPVMMNWNDTLVDVDWMQCDDMGYYFPDSPDIKVKRVYQTGSWTDIFSLSTDSTVYSKPMLSFWYDHGTYSSGSSYAYATLPTKDKSWVASYAQSDPIEVLANSASIHAVKDDSTDSVGVVFWPVDPNVLCVDFDQEDIVQTGMLELLTDWSDIGVKSGITGKANTADWVRRLRFGVSQGIINTNDVYVKVKWFDDANAPAGANWLLRYDSTTGMAQSSYVYYSRNGQWRETTLHLTDARFEEVCDSYGSELSIYHSAAPLDVTGDSQPDLYGPLVQAITITPANVLNPTATYSVDVVTSDKPCILFYQYDGNDLVLSLSQPEHKTETINIEVDMAMIAKELPDGVSCYVNNGVTYITFNVQNGRNYTCRFGVL